MAEKPEWARRAEKGGLLLENARLKHQIERARELLQATAREQRGMVETFEAVFTAITILSEDETEEADGV